MKNFTKNILSGFSVGIFVLIAMASQGVNSKFEPEYHESDCLKEAVATFEPSIDVKVIDKITGHPIPGAWVRVTISFYEGVEVDDTPRCQRRYRWGRNITLTTDEGGAASTSFTSVAFTTNLDKMMITIQADIIDYDLNKIVLVRTYNSTGKVNVTIPLIPVSEL